jgi:hypothetical protein
MQSRLLPDELRAQLPRLYSQSGTRDPTVHLKYFTPDSGWKWFVTEGEFVEDEFQFFGYVVGPFPEWGYFLLKDLEKSRGPSGAEIERDESFQPAPFSEVKRREQLDDAGGDEDHCGCIPVSN